MAWVVKTWRPEVIAAAEREARRLRRGAAREAEDAAAYLVVLEDLAAELREGLRAQRRDRPPRPLPIPEKRPAPVTPEPAGEITARRGRAKLRDSPLGELFRATGS